MAIQTIPARSQSTTDPQFYGATRARSFWRLLSSLIASLRRGESVLAAPGGGRYRFSDIEPLEPRILLISTDPNDQIGEAIPISVGDVVTGHEISPSGTSPDPNQDRTDVDLFSFTVEAGQRVSFDIDLPISGLDSLIILFDGEGNVIDSSEDKAAPHEVLGVESYLDCVFQTAGTYYIGVTAERNYFRFDVVDGDADVASLTSGPYTLILKNLPNHSTDPNDQISEAIPISVGDVVTGHAISLVGTQPDPDQDLGDVDMFSFTVTAGQRVGFDIDVPPNTLDARLFLFDSSGRQLKMGHYHFPAPDEDPEQNWEPYIEHSFFVAGTYYIAVAERSNFSVDPMGTIWDRYNTSGAYTLTLTDVAPLPSTDPNDQISEAIAISVGDVVTGHEISPVGTQPDPGLEPHDLDMFSFTVAAGQRVGFDIDNPAGGTLMSQIHLYDSEGLLLTYVSNGYYSDEDDSEEAYLKYTFEIAGTYFLGVTGVYNDSFDPITGVDDFSYPISTGQYTLILTDFPRLPSTDPNDQFSEAMPIAVGDVVTGHSISATGETPDPMSDLGDVDMFVFTATAGQRVGFDIDMPPGSPNPLQSVFVLYDSDGTMIDIRTGDSSDPAPGESRGIEPYMVRWFVNGGTYYLAVTAVGNAKFDYAYQMNFNPVDGTWDEPHATTGQYTLILTDLPTYSTDPDDQISEAIPVSVGQTVTGYAITAFGVWPDPNQDAADVDMFSFTVEEGQRVGFDIDMPDEYQSLYTRLFDSDGVQLALADPRWSASPDSDYGPYLEYTFMEAGMYYLAVAGGPNTSFNPLDGTGDWGSYNFGPYTLVLSNLSIIPSTDPNDQISEAVVVSMDSTVTGHRISPTGTLPDPDQDFGDVDMFRFTVNAGQRVEFDIDLPSAGLDSHIRLFTANGYELAFNDNGAAPDEESGTASYLAHTFTSGGTYYLGVSSNGNTSYDPTTGSKDGHDTSDGPYILIMTSLQPVSPDPNDQIGEAIDVSVGETVIGHEITAMGSIPDPGLELNDVDMFRFTVTAGQRVGFDIDMPPGVLYSHIRLFNDLGVELASNDVGVAPGEQAGNESYLAYTFTRAGTFYLGVSGRENTSYNPTNGTGDMGSNRTGPYTLILTELPPPPSTDPNDQISEAIPIAVGDRVVGHEISKTGTAPDPGEEPVDVDMFSFSVTAGQRVGFDIDLPSGGLDSHIRLFDSAGFQLASNDNRAAPGESSIVESYLDYTFATGGMYYLGVSGAPNKTYRSTDGTFDGTIGSTGPYILILINLPVLTPDPNDQMAEAISISVGDAVTGHFIQAYNTLPDPGFDPGDVDMFSFTVTAGQRVSFDIDRPYGVLDSYIRLFDAGGIELGNNDDAMAPGESFSRESYLVYTFTSPGTYYMGVSGVLNRKYSPITGGGDVNGHSTGPYKLILTNILLPGDLDLDAIIDARDIDLLTLAVAGAEFQTLFDLDGDAAISPTDIHFLVRNILNSEYGDADLDRLVSIGDLVILAANFNQPGGWAMGDFTGDGMVQLGDLVLLTEHFGYAPPTPLIAEESQSSRPEALWGLQAMGQGDAISGPLDEAADDEGGPAVDILAELAAGLRR